MAAVSAPQLVNQTGFGERRCLLIPWILLHFVPWRTRRERECVERDSSPRDSKVSSRARGGSGEARLRYDESRSIASIED